MNEKARDALVAAALRGHSQVRGALHADLAHDGDCALGVLHIAHHGGNRLAAVACWAGGRGCSPAFGRAWGICAEEHNEIIHANDNLGWDFLTIARKCCLGPEESA